MRGDGSVLAADAIERLSIPGLAEHIGFVDTVVRDGAEVVLVEVRTELRQRLTPRIAVALDGVPFRVRDAGIPDGVFYGAGETLEDRVEFPGVIVEPAVDDRPDLIQELRRRLDTAGVDHWIGSVGMRAVDGRHSLEIGLSRRAPLTCEPAIRAAVEGMPVARIFWRDRSAST